MQNYGPGLCTITLAGLSIERVCYEARRSSLKYLEWSGKSHVPQGDLNAASRVRAASEQNGLEATSYGSYFEAGVSDFGEFAVLVRTAKALGARNVRVWAGQRGIDPRTISPQELRRVAAVLRLMAQTAADEDLTVSLEFHRLTLTDGAQRTLDLLTVVDHPNLYSYWQPLPGVGPDQAAIELTLLEEHLSHIHMFCWDTSLRRYPLCDCTPLWEAVMRTVRNSPRWRSRPVAFLEFLKDDDISRLTEDSQQLHRLIRSHAG